MLFAIWSILVLAAALVMLDSWLACFTLSFSHDPAPDNCNYGLRFVLSVLFILLSSILMPLLAG